MTQIQRAKAQATLLAQKLQRRIVMTVVLAILLLTAIVMLSTASYGLRVADGFGSGGGGGPDNPNSQPTLTPTGTN